MYLEERRERGTERERDGRREKRSKIAAILAVWRSPVAPPPLSAAQSTAVRDWFGAGKQM